MVDNLSVATGYPQYVVQEVLDSVFAILKRELTTRGIVRMWKFGTVKLAKLGGRKMKNFEGEEVVIKDRLRAKFEPSATFKEDLKLQALYDKHFGESE